MLSFFPFGICAKSLIENKLSENGSGCFTSSIFLRYYTKHPNGDNNDLKELSLTYYWKRLLDTIESNRSKIRYPGSIYASMAFSYPYPRIVDCELITLAFLILVEQYAYNIESNYIKFTIGYNMSTPASYETPFTLGNAIPLHDTLGNLISNKKLVYEKIEKLVRINAEKYNDCEVKGIFINIYYQYDIYHKKVDFPNISYAYLISIVNNVLKNNEIGDGCLPGVKSLLYKRSPIPTSINTITGKKKQCRSFIVADLETVLENDVHIPYAAGFLVVNPDDDLTNIPSYSIQTFFSENHIRFYPTFQERSYKMLFEFFSNLEDCVKKNNRLRTIYLHNLGRFDGIFIMKYFVDRGNQYQIKPLMRNHKIYDLKIYIGDRLLFRFRDSLVLLPGSLLNLGKTLCPELGSKGSIDHDNISSSNLQLYKNDLIEYLRQDILFFIRWCDAKSSTNQLFTV